MAATKKRTAPISTTGKIKLSRARTTAANIGRSANFTTPRGGYGRGAGGMKRHGR